MAAHVLFTICMTPCMQMSFNVTMLTQYSNFTWMFSGYEAFLQYELMFYFFIFFFNSVLLPFQDYFSSYETGQSVGGAKTGEPREKLPDTPASRTWLVSHVARAGLEPTLDTAVR